VDDALEEVASTAEGLANEQREIADRVRALNELRADGWTWAKVFDERAPNIFDLLRASAKQIATQIKLLSRVVAEEMSSEGQTRRQIARNLGVSHQRVTTILRGTSAPNGDNGQ
jgi:hypothetical protein